MSRVGSTEELIKRAKVRVFAQSLDNPDLYYPVDIDIDPAQLVDYAGKQPLTREDIDRLDDDRTLIIAVEW